MSAKKWVGIVVLPDRELFDGAVVAQGDTIVWVGAESETPEQWRDLEPQNRVGDPEENPVFIIPGLIDVHCHGGGGASFPDATSLEDVATAANEHLRNGTTTLIASLVTAPLDVLEQRAALLADATDQGVIAGIHYEGPFVSEARCGAQDPRYIIKATPEAMERLVRAARGRAVSMTIAPEQIAGASTSAADYLDPQGGPALEVLLAGDILPSWGHTDSSIIKAENAVNEGILLMEHRYPSVRGGRATVTHLFNGMRPLHHRDPGPIPVFLSQAKAGRVVVELINDGTHVDTELATEIVQLVGRDNAVFVTDAMAAAGMADGEYVLGPASVTVKDGVARLTEGGAIAGGTSRLIDCVRTATTGSGVRLDLVDAVYLASTQGAKILGLSDRGELAPGKRADLVVLEGPRYEQIVSVVRGGEEVALEASE